RFACSVGAGWRRRHVNNAGNGAITSYNPHPELSSAEATLCLDPLVGGIDFARALLGTALELGRHVAELVRMMLADQLSISALDLASVRLTRDAEHGVGIPAAVIPRRFARRLLVARAGFRAVHRVGIAAHRRQRGQFSLVHAERPAQLAHQRELV